MNTTLTILHSDALQGVTTFNYTLAEAVKDQDAANVCELHVLNPIEKGFKQRFIDTGIKIFDASNPKTYDVVFINNRSGLNWVIKNNITATRYIYFVHSLPTDESLQNEVFPPRAGALVNMLGGAVEIVVLSQKSKDYFDGLGYTTTLVKNAINMNRFKDKGYPTKLQKILIFDLRNNILYREKIMNLATLLPNVYVRSITVPTWDIEAEIDDADLVIGYGRSAIEAMATGKPTIIYGINGGDGMVLDSNKDDLAKTNFSGWSRRSLPLPEDLFELTLLQEIQRASSADSLAIQTFIRTTYDTVTLLTDLNIN